MLILCSFHNENKSDISYLKTSRAFDINVLIHSGKPNSVG